MSLKLLALCARDVGSDQLYEFLDAQLHEFARGTVSWEELFDQAEHHGISPLLSKHVQAIGFPLPRQARRMLQTLDRRSVQASRIRNQAVADLLLRCRDEGVEVLTVKGIALANLIYSEPGLRPMRDVDLLVDEPDLAKMTAILADQGYAPEVRTDIPEDYYHLVPMARKIEGLTITVEVHRNLLPYHPEYPAWPLARSRETSLPFTIDNVSARTLCLEELLHHVYLHGFRPPLTYEPFRLVHLADIVSLVEQRLGQIDWDRVQADLPNLRQILSSLHCLTPWTANTVQRLGLNTLTRPDHPGQPYRGWPRRRLGATPFLELPLLFRDTLLPPQWWMQVYYGCLPGRNLWRARWLDHPLLLYRWAKAYSLQWLRSGGKAVD